MCGVKLSWYRGISAGNQREPRSNRREAGCKWFISALKRYLISCHGKERVESSFWQIQMLIIRTLLAVQKTIMHDKHCFELYGYDIMLDNDVRCRENTSWRLP